MLKITETRKKNKKIEKKENFWKLNCVCVSIIIACQFGIIQVKLVEIIFDFVHKCTQHLLFIHLDRAKMFVQFLLRKKKKLLDEVR